MSWLAGRLTRPTRIRSLVALSIIQLCTVGCETTGEIVAEVDQVLYEAVPTHPVTGRPMANLVSEEKEIALARESWQQLADAAERGNIAIDPPGARSEQIQRVFSNLVAVAHRQHLTWEVHLLRHPMANAMTPGGGMVFVFEGIFTDHPAGQGFVRPDDDHLAAVLAHEIAHVTLMHMAESQTSAMFTDRHKKDPYYSASYGTADEAEADKLSVLYMALAGYDPSAAAQVWQEAHQRHGSDPGLYLYDHPVNDARMRLAAEAASEVLVYYKKGEQNAEWPTILRDNPLFPRTAEAAPQPGAGFEKAVEATAEAVGRHDAAKEEAKQRERAALLTPEVQATFVRLLETKPDPQGRALIWMNVQNGASYDVAAIGVRVVYLQQRQPIAQDPTCGGSAIIPAGQSAWLSCPYLAVQGADNLSVEITGVEFR